MNTLKGIAGTLLIQAGFYCCPPDHDAAFMAVRGASQAAAILGCLTLVLGGFGLILSGGLSESKSAPAPEATREVE